MINLRQKKFLLVSNITDHSGPTEGLADFLQRNSNLLVTIYHPFYYCQGKRSKVNLFKKGKLITENISPPLALPEFLKYLLDLFLTFYYTLKFKNKFDFYLGINCLHALVGLVYRKFGLVNKVIFYTIDWMPHRFKNPFYNWLYFKIDCFSRQNADFVWNLSEKITQIRKDQGVPNYKNLFVPNGVNFQNIKRPLKSQIKKEVLVLLGALHPDKGVDLVIKAMSKIWQKFPQIKLVVIGNTPKINKIKPYEKILSSLDKRITVLGSISHQKVLSLLPKIGIGLAPYHPQKNNFSYYAWPARVIDYLACGLPVIITPVPLIAKKIAQKKAGILINYHQKDLIVAVTKLLTNDAFYWQARKNAYKLAHNFNWNKIFRKAFSKIETIDEKLQINQQKKVFNKISSQITKYKLEKYHLSYQKKVFSALKIPGDGRYLDIGCGCLGYLVIEASRQGQKAIGLELSHKLLFKAKSFAQKELGKNSLYQFIYGKAENLPFPNNYFSKISAIAILEHIYNDEVAIKEMARVLKPGGKIFIMVPNSYLEYWPPFRWYYQFAEKKIGHLRHYSLKDLQFRLKNHGLQIIKYRYTGHLPKIIQYFFTLIYPSFIKSKWWWELEKMDFKLGTVSSGLHLDLVIKKGK